MLRGMRRKNKLCQESDRMLLVQCTNHTIHSVNPQTKYKGWTEHKPVAWLKEAHHDEY